MKSGCYECSLYNRHILSEKYFDSSPMEKNAPALLYIFQMPDTITQFIKIGITRKNTTQSRYITYTRLGGKKLYEVESTLYEVWKIEQALLNNFSQFRYYPNIKFSGKTECLNNITLENIQEYLHLYYPHIFQP